MAAAAGGLMSGVEARAVTDVVLADMEEIRRKNLDPKTREPNDSIELAIDAARESGRPGLPVAIQLNMTPDFTAGDLVFLYTAPASPEKLLHLRSVFTVHTADPGDQANIILSIYRIDASITLDSVIAEYDKLGIDLNGVVWMGRLPTKKSGNGEPFTFSVNKARCVLVTRYTSRPDQLVVVMGPPATAGGAKRKRVISRKLKSLNKKRKYTQRRFRRRYSYKGGRKN